MKYGKSGSPFNFLGRLSESQKDSFYEWMDKKLPLVPEAVIWHRAKAQQLRKTAALLESLYPDLTPPFEKEAWKPNPDGHFNGTPSRDAVPSTVVSRLKDRFRPMLQRDDEAVFWMNSIRTQIERHEDAATILNEAKTDTQVLRAELDALFGKPEYEATLVKDKTSLYKGEPYFRTNSLDEPTIWEKEQMDHTFDLGE